jgi:putative thioredoxin
MNDYYDIHDFEQEVIKESEITPVLVDFWASWCQPCRVLGPILEELERENKGRFKLAKVNTEEHQQVASKYNISSIPAVKLFSNGEVIAEFVGALPKNQIEKFLDENIPSENKKAFLEIKQQLNSLPENEAIEKLKAVLQNDPNLIEAKVELAKILAFTNPDEAKKLISGLQEDSPFFFVANAIRTIHEFINLSDTQKLAESIVKEDILSARNALLNKDFDKTLEILINTLIKDKTYLDEIARRMCVAMFNVFGQEHELTKKYRKRFDMYLY